MAISAACLQIELDITATDKARKVPIANYDRNLKGIMQEICDDLMNQNVLKFHKSTTFLFSQFVLPFYKEK